VGAVLGRRVEELLAPGRRTGAGQVVGVERRQALAAVTTLGDADEIEARGVDLAGDERLAHQALPGQLARGREPAAAGAAAGTPRDEVGRRRVGIGVAPRQPGPPLRQGVARAVEVDEERIARPGPVALRGVEIVHRAVGQAPRTVGARHVVPAPHIGMSSQPRQADRVGGLHGPLPELPDLRRDGVGPIGVEAGRLGEGAGAPLQRGREIVVDLSGRTLGAELGSRGAGGAGGGGGPRRAAQQAAEKEDFLHRYSGRCRTIPERIRTAARRRPGRGPAAARPRARIPARRGRRR